MREVFNMPRWIWIAVLLAPQATSAHGPLGQDRAPTSPEIATTAVAVEKRLRAGEGYQVVREFELQSAQAPSDPAPKVRAARVYEGLGDLAAATAAAEEALALDPYNAEALATLGRMAAREGAWEASAAHLRRAAASDPNNPSIQLDLGNALQQLGDQAGADAAYIAYRSLVGLPRLMAIDVPPEPDVPPEADAPPEADLSPEIDVPQAQP